MPLTLSGPILTKFVPWLTFLSFEGVYANYRHPGPRRVLGEVKSDRFGSKPLQNRPEPASAGNNRACSGNTRAIYGPPGAIQDPNMANTWPKKKRPYIRTIYGHVYGLYTPDIPIYIGLLLVFSIFFASNLFHFDTIYTE